MIFFFDIKLKEIVIKLMDSRCALLFHDCELKLISFLVVKHRARITFYPFSLFLYKLFYNYFDEAGP